MKTTKAKTRFLGSGGLKEPKRPATAYFIFVQDKRSTLKGSMGEIAKQLSALWGALEKDEKDAYDTKAKDLKAKYDEEMVAFKESDGYKNYIKAMAAGGGGGSASKKVAAGK